MRRITFFVFALFMSFVLLAGCGPPPTVNVPAAGQLEKQTVGTHRLTADVPDVGVVNYAIEVAESYDSDTPAPLVLLLHYGYEGSVPETYTGADMIDTFRTGLSELGSVAIAPDVVGGDWTDPRNEKAAVWLVNSAMKTYNIDPKKVIVTGFSMGGEGTWFIGSRHQDVFTAAIPIAAPVAGSTKWDIPVYVIHSNSDEVVSFSAAKSHADAVKAGGAAVEFTTASGLSHYDSGSYAPHFLEAVRWVEANWD